MSETIGFIAFISLVILLFAAYLPTPQQLVIESHFTKKREAGNFFPVFFSEKNVHF